MQIALVAIALLTCPIFAQAPDPAREAQRAQELVVAGKFDEAIRIYQDLVRDKRLSLQAGASATLRKELTAGAGNLHSVEPENQPVCRTNRMDTEDEYRWNTKVMKSHCIHGSR